MWLTEGDGLVLVGGIGRLLPVVLILGKGLGRIDRVGIRWVEFGVRDITGLRMESHGRALYLGLFRDMVWQVDEELAVP